MNPMLLENGMNPLSIRVFFSPTLSAREKNFSKNLFSKSNIEVCICDTKSRMERLINNACC